MEYFPAERIMAVLIRRDYGGMGSCKKLKIVSKCKTLLREIKQQTIVIKAMAIGKELSIQTDAFN